MVQRLTSDGLESPWLLTGSSRGFLTLWDMRFQIPLTQWSHPLKSPVEALAHAKAPAGTVWLQLCILCTGIQDDVGDGQDNGCRSSLH